jgi:hypothetical protein
MPVTRIALAGPPLVADGGDLVRHDEIVDADIALPQRLIDDDTITELVAPVIENDGIV